MCNVQSTFGLDAAFSLYTLHPYTLHVPPMPLCRADKLLLSGGAAAASGAVLFGPLGAAVPAGALLALMMDGIFRPTSSVFFPTLSHGARDRNEVALTFDDGPDPELTPRILDVLAGHGAQATFFVIGRHLEAHAAIGRRAVEEGHELGNHSWQHSYLQNFYSTSRYAADVQRASELIRQVSRADEEPLFRAPVGLKSPGLARVAQARRLRMIAWSLHSRDTFSRDPAATAARVLSHIRPGDIVLLHDGHEHRSGQRRAGLDALPSILTGLKQRGLRSVTVSRLLAER